MPKAGQPLTPLRLDARLSSVRVPLCDRGPVYKPEPLFEGQGWLLHPNCYFCDSAQVGEERQLPPRGKS